MIYVGDRVAKPADSPRGASDSSQFVSTTRSLEEQTVGTEVAGHKLRS